MELLILVLISTVTATLTTGGTVTASSVMDGYSLSTVVDGNFSNLHSCTDCPGCFSTNNEAGAAWINVQLLHPTIVQSVLVVNREDPGFINNLVGSEIRVGYNALPALNQLCATVSTSGIYVCATAIQGDRVGIYNSNMNGLALELCEIRAYPWVPN